MISAKTQHTQISVPNQLRLTYESQYGLYNISDEACFIKLSEVLSGHAYHAFFMTRLPIFKNDLYYFEIGSFNNK